MSLSESIPIEKMAILREYARSRRYSLLLGAGASLGATNTSGPLPLAHGLIERLARKFPTAHIDDGITLQRAYQRACLCASKEEVWYFFKDVFGGASHNAWFNRLTLYPWKRVWTLNIDDAFERAYQASKKDSHPRLATISWDQDYMESSDLEVIHLHGHILGENPTKLIFSLSEYVDSARRETAWNQVLSAQLPSEPFIVAGARILDDPDVEAMLMDRASLASSPSFIVDPGLNEGNSWELSQQGFIPLKMEAIDFFHEWETLFSLEGFVDGTERTYITRIPQLIPRLPDRAAAAQRSHDYLGGDPPLWSDAVDENIALLPGYKDVLEHVHRWRTEERCELVIVYASRMTGLTSLLLTVAMQALASGIDVYQFDRSSRFSVPDMIDFAHSAERAVILIDGCADFADDVDETLSELARLGSGKVLFLVGETLPNALRLESHLSGGYEKKLYRVSNHLDKDDSRSLAKFLSTKARLGRLEGTSVREIAGVLRGRDIFSGMMDISFGSGFRKRLEAEIQALNTWQRDLVILLAVAAIANREVSLVEAHFALGIPSDRIIRAIDSNEALSALTEIHESLLQTRQRDNALPELVRRMGNQEVLISIQKFLTNLKPLANDRALRERNRAAVLVGHLMGFRTLSRLLGDADFSDFYSRLESSYGSWNGRFWEQRAIYYKSVGGWPRAESYAARSVSIFPAPYARTTLGTILINRAEVEAFGSDEGLWLQYYQRGAEQFNLVEQVSSESRVTQFAYLNAALALIKVLQASNLELTGHAQVVMDEWQQHYASLSVVLRSDPDDTDSLRRLNYLSSQWERVAARSAGLDAFLATVRSKNEYAYQVQLVETGERAILKFRDCPQRYSIRDTLTVHVVRRRDDGKVFVRPT